MVPLGHDSSSHSELKVEFGSCGEEGGLAVVTDAVASQAAMGEEGMGCHVLSRSYHPSDMSPLSHILGAGRVVQMSLLQVQNLCVRERSGNRFHAGHVVAPFTGEIVARQAADIRADIEVRLCAIRWCAMTPMSHAQQTCGIRALYYWRT